KDEIIFGAGAMVWDPTAGDSGMWVPASAANPLEVRVRQLEAQIEELQELLEMRLNANLSTLASNTSLNTVRDYIGSTGDAAASAGGTGSVSAKLRRLTADLADVLARLNTDLPTRASEQTLVQARDALSAL